MGWGEDFGVGPQLQWQQDFIPFKCSSPYLVFNCRISALMHWCGEQAVLSPLQTAALLCKLVL